MNTQEERDMEEVATHGSRQSNASLDQMLELLSLGSSLESAPASGSSASVGGGSAPGASGSLIASMRGLRSWDPWTNRQAGQGRRQQEHLPESALDQCRATRKAAGSLYDSMVRAERLATARAAYRAAVQLLNTNNSTNELDVGLKDIQRHGAGGQRTTVITRLAAGASIGDGGVLDVNFVMDSNSSNTTDTTNRRGPTTDDSNDTDDWRWNHDADKTTAAQPRGSKGQPSQRESKNSMNQKRESRDSLSRKRESKDSMSQKRESKDSMSQKRESNGPPSQRSASLRQQGNQRMSLDSENDGRQPKESRNYKRASVESLNEHPVPKESLNQQRESKNFLNMRQQRESNGEPSESPDQPSLQDSKASSGMPSQRQQPWEWESQTPPDRQEQQTDEDTAAGEGDEGEEFEGDSEGRELEDEEEPPPQSEEKQNVMSVRKKLSVCHLQKEGILIGCMNVFADVMKREFIVLLTDSVVAAFLLEPSQFRAVASRTGCEIEVTRRILNRRIGGHRWVKYLVLTIKGPNMTAIDQCDRLMVKLFPPYKIRKEYLEPAAVALFVKESYPDNTNLYFNFQRTGPTRDRLGELRLQTPFEPNTSGRPLENTPWKYADWRLYKGLLEPRNLAGEHVIQHIYPEWGTEVGNYIDKTQKWENAGDAAIDIEKKKNLERSLRVKHRKMEAEPLFAENT